MKKYKNSKAFNAGMSIYNGVKITAFGDERNDKNINIR